MSQSLPRTRQPVEVTFPRFGLVAVESRHARGFTMPPLRHDYLKALVTFAGEGRLRSTAGELPARRGSLLVVPPNCEHHLEDLRPLSLYAICFRPDEFADGWPNELCESGHPIMLADPTGQWPAWARELLHAQAVPSVGTPALVRALGWHMLAWLARTHATTRAAEASPRAGQGDSSDSRARVRIAAAELRRHFHEPLTIDLVARRAGLGRRRFTQLFREEQGVTWWEALRDARLDHAEHLLRGKDRSVTSVAFECGFGDLSGFYRAWTSRHACSPAAWRESVALKDRAPRHAR